MFDFLALSKKYEGSCEIFWPAQGRHSLAEAAQLFARQGVSLYLEDVVYDSRRVRPGSLYVAISGEKYDGLSYINEVVRKGAAACVAENIEFAEACNIPCLRVKDSRAALAYFSYQNYFAQLDAAADRQTTFEPEKPMLVACCGSQGRETSARYLGEMLRKFHVSTAISYEMQLDFGGMTCWTGRTKNQAPEWMSALATTRKQGIPFLLAPVSPLDIRLKRITAYPHYLCFLDQDSDFSMQAQSYYLDSVAVVLQLKEWRPSLDYFLQQLRETKKPFILVLNTAVAQDFCVAGDGIEVYWSTLSSQQQRVSDIVLLNALELQKLPESKAVDLSVQLRLRLWSQREKESDFVLRPSLFGGFAVENWLRALAFLLLGRVLNLPMLPSVEVKGLLSLLAAETVQIPGRSQLIYTEDGRRIVIDSAWRPKHLIQLGEAFRPWVEPYRGRILLVFGSGGNRSYFDRLAQGQACAEIADELALTVTSPRSEEVEEIMQQLQEGCKLVKDSEFPCFADRLAALEFMLKKARPEDLILLAGRGEEAYSIHISGLDLRTDRELIAQAQGVEKIGDYCGKR